MKVLLVEPAHDHSARGNRTTVQRYARLLAARGIDVAITSPIAVNAVGRDFRPDILHAHHAVHCGPAALATARSLAIPFIVSLGGTDARGGPNGGPKPEALPVLRDADLIMGPFAADAVLLDEAAPDHAPFAVVRRGIAVPKIAPAARPGCLGSPWRFLFSGGLRDVKNPLRAVDLVARLRRRGQDVELVIAGPAIERALAVVVAERIDPQHDRLLGEVAAEAMPALYDASDVLINTSRSEGASNAILEAWAAGRAVLASDVSGNRELLGAAPAAIGALFGDPGDSEIAAFLARLRDMPPGDVAVAAFNHLRAHHDEADEAADLLQAYALVRRLT